MLEETDHVTLHRKLVKGQALNGHPANGQPKLALHPVVTVVLDVAGQTEVGDLHDVLIGQPAQMKREQEGEETRKSSKERRDRVVEPSEESDRAF